MDLLETLVELIEVADNSYVALLVLSNDLITMRNGLDTSPSDALIYNVALAECHRCAAECHRVALDREAGL